MYKNAVTELAGGVGGGLLIRVLECRDYCLELHLRIRTSQKYRREVFGEELKLYSATSDSVIADFDVLDWL